MIEILKYTKMVNDAFIEVNGSLKVSTSSQIGKRNLSDRKMDFLREYIRFVKESGLLSQASLIYLDSDAGTPMEAIHVYNATCGKYKQITASKASNHFYYDSKKLLQLFPEDMLKNIIFTKTDISIYEAIFQAAISKKTGNSFLGKMTILKMPGTVNSERPSDEAINEFFIMFAPYTKKSIAEVEQLMPKEVVGYINYIANKKERSDDEEALIQRIKHINDPIEIE